MRKNFKYIYLLLTFVILTALDQLSKYLAVKYLKWQIVPIINNVFELHYHENDGAAWGILSGKLSFLTIISTIVMCAIVYVIIKLNCFSAKKYSVLQFVLTILCAGATGNLIDRIRLGYVIDYFYFKLIDFPIFNVADCYVTISVIIILFMILFKFTDEELNLILKKDRKV